MYNRDANYYNNIGISQFQKNNFESAISSFRLGLSFAKNQNDGNFIDILNYNLAVTYEKLGDAYKNKDEYYSRELYNLAFSHINNYLDSEIKEKERKDEALELKNRLMYNQYVNK